MTVAAPRQDFQPGGVTRGAAFAGVTVCAQPRDALDAWRALNPAVCGSFYQSEDFLLAWLECFARQQKVEPFFIVARDALGAPLALLPFGVFRFGPLRIAQFLGGKHCNANLGLFRADAAFAARDLRLLLREAARAKGGPHLYRLLNLPLVWRGAANPLVLLPHRPAANRGYATKLGADGEAWLAARLSAQTRKKLRKKEQRLAGMGALRHVRAANPEQAGEILDAFFRQKRLRGAGPREGGEAAATRAFYAALAAFAQSGAPPALELHALELDGRVIATFAAGHCGGRLQGLFNSFDPDPEIARSSPGEILLTHVLRDACARKIAAFDLGLGDARYKTTFCDEIEAMADAFYAPGLAGLAAQAVFAAGLAAKAAIKTNPGVWRLVEQWRRRRGAARGVSSY
ncbi:GNAT family N-acetyltransferase [uncultured Rhodoblastus sp.]|uniref:GNAT family N-acetyltransferase n=1 Tax=uncultured Rhodoblastus sp. TaxID=543037 RepID=UPI0025CBFF90|nr:GNAT family N-acetyltransferase [uncultured Rhodoblastus sp.]